jgi:hypothetical protein
MFVSLMEVIVEFLCGVDLASTSAVKPTATEATMESAAEA